MTRAPLLSANLVVVAVFLFGSTVALAAGAGVDSSWYAAGGCNECHTGGAGPVVSLSGPGAVERGTTATLSLTVAGGAGAVAGLNVSPNRGSSTATLRAGTQTGVKAVAGPSYTEITQTAPRPFSSGSAVFSFELLAAPGAACGTTVTLTGWGLSADDNNTMSGDRASSAARSVAISCRAAGASCAVGYSCVSALCRGSVCCASAACTSSCSTCADAGACVAAAAGTPCDAGFTCDGAGLACPTTCTTDAGCATGRYCAGGTACPPTRPDGTLCGSGVECTSGRCVDGVCCDSACAGQCEACDAPGSLGTCAPVVGAPRGARAACASDGTACAGACDGLSRASCTFPDAGVSCRGASCAAGLATLAEGCNGAGACPALRQLACAPFLCGSTACAGDCTQDSDCAMGAWCQAGVCTPKGLAGVGCSAASQCASGFCVDGVCCDAACAGACEACNLAGSLGACQPINDAGCAEPPDAGSDGGFGGGSGGGAPGCGCGASLVGSPLAGLLLVMLLRRRAFGRR